jgi:hypothetical protein
MTGLRETVAAKRAEIDHAPAPLPAPTAGFGGVNRERVLQIVGLDPRDPKAHAVVAVAERYQLDPVLGHVQILGNSRMPYVTRDGFLHIAHRSGQLDGIEVVDGPRRDGSEWVATVAVYRKDMSRPFTYPGRAELGRDNGPEMALARAERRALKRAFAVTLPGEFAEDEHDPRSAAPPAQPDPPSGDPQPVAQPPVIESAAEPDPFDKPINAKQMRAMHAAFRQAGITDRAERLATASGFIGRDITTANELTVSEAATVLSRLAELEHDNQPHDDQEQDGET